MTCVFGKQSLPPCQCHLPSHRKQALLLPKIRSQLAEFPRLGSPYRAEPFQLGAPVLVLGTGMRNRWVLPFHGPQESVQFPHKSLNCFSSQRDSAVLSSLDGISSAGPIPKRRQNPLRCRAYPHGAGILTRFPFARFRLGARLGPPNPWLTNIAKETVPYQPSRILTWICCY